MPYDYKKIKDLDLAMEAKESLQGKINKEIEGVKETVNTSDYTKITEIEILNQQGAETMGRNIGKYITIEIPQLPTYDRSTVIDGVVNDIVLVLQRFYKINKTKPTLIIGLGNTFTAPDALGPEVISHIQPTAHIFNNFEETIQKKISPVCLFTPGVLGNTGIPTFDTVKSIVEETDPGSIIIIDALATTSITRICNTVQLTDTGIRPGSGINRNNKEINTNNMNVPIIAIGIPTIMHAGTIINEAIESCLSNPKLFFKSEDENIIVDTVEDLLMPYSGDLMVTPKEINTMIPICAKILASAIVKTVHPGLDNNNYQDFMQ